ncbi:allophanate hydrolase [Serinicoccus chungangensis]|uniref:Allophanate hydrolase n=1 Tax=Serinicoccus chungangensis TaxID=767452 RepID=A0A0W8I419_9MICO|nr:allophanate hydrolase subunit 1 [Serinicoccus chungangensis]KUG52785.1 allophanate hydrolase [Serinicoccus chungangensis]
MDVTLLPMGPEAVLVEVAGTGEVLALADALRAGGWGVDHWASAVTEVVPAARTLLVRVADPSDLPVVREGLVALAAGLDAPPDVAATPHAPEDAVVVPVTYDGADLAEVARLTGLAEEEVVRAHTGSVWRVGFIGFAPGFAYLVGGDERLHVPRRDSPRTTVPAGSVGLAGEFGGIYPRESPGGWQLIGRTDALLWDVERDPPALLAPGATVRFEEA